MKTLKLVSLAMTAMAFSIFLLSCESNPDIAPQQTILPESMTVDIPATLSYTGKSAGRRSGRLKEDSLKGNDIYQHLGTFIAVGDAASRVVRDIVVGLRRHRIDRVMSMTYLGDDSRAKNLVVEANVSFEGSVWDYQMTITDADDEGNADGGKAMQLFWNKHAPIKGIAILKPYNCNRIENVNAGDAMFRINYTRESSRGYDAEMEVLISGLPLENPLSDPYSVSTLKMFAGKQGDVVDVYGNSNHPNAILFSGTPGFNWAFVASGNDALNAGVAEVGLPASTLDSDSRDVLLKEYSIKNVFTNEIKTVWPGIDQQLLDVYLKSTAAPGYFNDGGFIAGGTSPGSTWTKLALRLEDLAPYNPKAVSGLVVSFE